MNLVATIKAAETRQSKAELKQLNSERFQAKKEANSQFKANTFSLFGIINYMSKEFFNPEGDLSIALDFPRFNYATNRKEFKEVVTIDYLKSCLGERGLFNWSKDADGKRTVRGEEKTLFSFYTVLTAIQKYERAQ